MSYYFKPLDRNNMTARAMVLSLLSSRRSEPETISRLIQAASLFDIEASTLRVAVTRLIKDGLLESPSRGLYQPGPKSRSLVRRLQDWQNVDSKIVRWDGGWLIALTQHLGRTDRKQLTARERALGLSGYRRTPEGVWARPANLSQPLDEHRRELIAIGADEDILLLHADAIELPDASVWPDLWSADELAAAYVEATRAMEDSLERLGTLPVPDAARESLLIGQAVIRLINYDPLLPPELADQKGFLNMVETMRRYNEAGQESWQAFFTAG